MTDNNTSHAHMHVHTHTVAHYTHCPCVKTSTYFLDHTHNTQVQRSHPPHQLNHTLHIASHTHIIHHTSHCTHYTLTLTPHMTHIRYTLTLKYIPLFTLCILSLSQLTSYTHHTHSLTLFTLHVLSQTLHHTPTHPHTSHTCIAHNLCDFSLTLKLTHTSHTHTQTHCTHTHVTNTKQQHNTGELHLFQCFETDPVPMGRVSMKKMNVPHISTHVHHRFIIEGKRFSVKGCEEV
jgi:hypothetical protein